MRQKSLTDFMNEVIKDLCVAGSVLLRPMSTVRFALLYGVCGGGSIYFGAFSKRSLRRFQTYMEERQLSYNTISTYLRSLRAVYNSAVDADLVRGEFRLFAGLKTGVASERKLAVTALQMQKLLKQPLSAGALKASTVRLSGASGSDDFLARMQKARDCFSLMLFLQGMPYVDLTHLRKCDLSGNLLTCRRRKTGTELCIRVTPEAMALIERYGNHDEHSPYLLNLLGSNPDGEEDFHQYRSNLRGLNYYLSFLPSLCGLHGLKISSYTPRHTWATLAKYCQVPEEIISEGLGHSSLEVTRSYLKSFEGDELAKANRIIIDYIWSGNKTLWNKQ